jgi:hypothetical protein
MDEGGFASMMIRIDDDSIGENDDSMDEGGFASMMIRIDDDSIGENDDSHR